MSNVNWAYTPTGKGKTRAFIWSLYPDSFLYTFPDSICKRLYVRLDHRLARAQSHLRAMAREALFGHRSEILMMQLTKSIELEKD